MAGASLLQVFAEQLVFTVAARGLMTDRAGRMPLHYAALEGEVDTVRGLVEDGADPDAADSAGFTPLHFAAQGRHVEAARALLQAGASIDPENRFGNTPLWVATMNAREDGAVVQLLLARGADPEHTNKMGVSPRGIAETVANYDLGQFFS